MVTGGRRAEDTHLAHPDWPTMALPPPHVWEDVPPQLCPRYLPGVLLSPKTCSGPTQPGLTLGA